MTIIITKNTRKITINATRFTPRISFNSLGGLWSLWIGAAQFGNIYKARG